MSKGPETPDTARHGTYLSIGPSAAPWLSLTGWAATLTLCSAVMGVAWLVLEIASHVG